MKINTTIKAFKEIGTQYIQSIGIFSLPLIMNFVSDMPIITAAMIVYFTLVYE